MARLEFAELGRLALDMEALAAMPEAVPSGMLDAAADVLMAAQKQKADAMLQGPYNRGAVAAGIRKGQAKKSGSGMSLDISFEGSQHGRPLTEIAYVNEYGKIGQAARPFIRTANEEHGEAAAEAAQRVLDEYTQSNGL